MPFGLIFGALFFGGLCVWASLGLLSHSVQPAKIAGSCLLLLGFSLAAGLLLRRRWARWVGSFSAVLIATFVLRLVDAGAGVLEHVILLASVAAAALLVIPATGDPRRGAAPGSAASGRVARLLGPAAIIALVGLVGSGGWWAFKTPGEPRSRAQTDLPRAAHAPPRIPWTSYGEGLERSRVESKPMLITFFTNWCPYCKKMDQSTWKARLVVERLAGIVAVRVDAEETESRHGYAGAQLASRYEVRGFPSQLLMNPDGRIISRLDGYLSPAELLNWLDETLGAGPGPRSEASLRGPGR